MVTVTIFGQGYQSPGDGGDIESTMWLSDEEYEVIQSLAKKLDKDIDELSFYDLPDNLQERMEKVLNDDWGFQEGEKWNTFVNGFSIER